MPTRICEVDRTTSLPRAGARADRRDGRGPLRCSRRPPGHGLRRPPVPRGRVCATLTVPPVRLAGSRVTERPVGVRGRHVEATGLRRAPARTTTVSAPAASRCPPRSASGPVSLRIPGVVRYPGSSYGSRRPVRTRRWGAGTLCAHARRPGHRSALPPHLPARPRPATRTPPPTPAEPQRPARLDRGPRPSVGGPPVDQAPHASISGPARIGPLDLRASTGRACTLDR